MSVVVCGGEGCKLGRVCDVPHVSFVGAVLDKFERNGYDDSDFYALVWDDAYAWGDGLGCVRAVWYASTSSWTYHNGVSVDATEEVKARAVAWLRPLWLKVRIERAHVEANRPRVGLTVRSLTTRGKNVGVTGVVKWRGDSSYGDGERVGIYVGETKLRYVDAHRVAVLDPPDVDVAGLKACAESLTVSDWYAVYTDVVDVKASA